MCYIINYLSLFVVLILHVLSLKKIKIQKKGMVVI